MRQIIITLVLLLGLNLSAQEKKAYQLENGIIKVEQFYATGGIQQISYYLEGMGVGTWLKYDNKGNLTSKAEVKNGRPIKVTHYRDGYTTIINRKNNSVTKVKK